MAIGAEQRAYLLTTLKNAIARYYGESALTLDAYRNKRRSTFLEKLETEVGAADMRLVLNELAQLTGAARAAQTRTQNELQTKTSELRAKHDKEKTDLAAKQQTELTNLTLHYAPAKQECDERVVSREKDQADKLREFYFKVLGIEDDGRSLYRGLSIDEALRQRVDDYIESHLLEDEEGARVLKRMEQETLVSDSAYISEKMPAFREEVLRFIAAGKLPALTVEAWEIEDGKDTRKAI